MRARTSARLGADFAKLWTASAVSNLGDGITMVWSGAAAVMAVVAVAAWPHLGAASAVDHSPPR